MSIWNTTTFRAALGGMILLFASLLLMKPADSAIFRDAGYTQTKIFCDDMGTIEQSLAINFAAKIVYELQAEDIIRMMEHEGVVYNNEYDLIQIYEAPGQENYLVVAYLAGCYVTDVQFERAYIDQLMKEIGIQKGVPGVEAEDAEDGEILFSPGNKGALG